MAAQARASIASWQERTFDMRSLRRLAIWGGAATIALAIAVVSAYSQGGSRQAMAASASAGNAQKGDARTALPDARAPAMETERQRLADAVRVLVADREQLMARIGTLERSLEDITGATKRQDTPRDPRQDSTAAAQPASSSGSSAAPPANGPLPPKDSTAGSQPQPSAPERLANAPAVVTEEAAVTDAPKGEFGIDVGGAANFEGLRVLWASTKANNGALFEGVHPAVAVRENSRAKTPELRLIVGPLADVEAAARLCARVSAGRRYCQPVAFEGQRLADADMAPEQKPAAVPKPPSKPASKPASKAPPPPSQLQRLFR
jgi:hypothetical protein